MGAMLAGVPFSAISPAYSLISQDFGKLKHVFEVLTPGMVYVSDGQAFAKAIQACITSDIEVVTNKGIVGDQICTSFQSLLNTPVSNVQEFYQTLDENQIAKFLFTSGSTKLPKAVPTTHLMLCVNQQMLLQTFLSLKKRRLSYSTGCLGTTHLAAVTMSASHSITAVPFTLMMANPLQENLTKPFVISKKFLQLFT